YWNRKLNAADTASLSARFDARIAAFTEADPLFAAATADAITANDTSYWNRKLNAADTASLSARINAKTGLMQTGNQTGNLLYWNGTEWARVNPGQTGNVLTYRADGAPVAGMPFDTLTQAQRLAIAAPSNSRMVYQTNADTGFYMYKKSSWHRLAAYQNETNGSLALGFESGQGTQGQQSVAIGYRSGYTGQGSTSVAVGTEAGRDTQGVQATALGLRAGFRQQGQNAVAVGWSAGYLNQGVGATAVGMNAGQNTQGAYATALGRGSGFQAQGAGATALGMDAGRDSQSVNAIAVGFQAGYSKQGLEAVAVGPYAGYLRQGNYGIALGRQAAFQDQDIHALAIGHWSAYAKQGISAIALGTEAGRDTQSHYAIAIGHHAGNKRQGQSAIAIGTKAGFTDQHTNSIILNASGSTVNSTYTGALFIAPIRNAASGTTTLHYDPASKEVFYSTNTSDLRLKRNVQPIPSGLATLLQLRPVSFDMKLNLRDTLYPVHKAGFIAQEVQQVLPGLVSPLPGPDTLLTLNTSDMIPLLVKAVQELHAENQVLKQETSALREKIAQGASVQDKKRRP
ncbi:MAG: Ostreococcus tauri virus 1, partial [Bacteroidota bacterium]